MRLSPTARGALTSLGICAVIIALSIWLLHTIRSSAEEACLAAGGTDIVHNVYGNSACYDDDGRFVGAF